MRDGVRRRVFESWTTPQRLALTPTPASIAEQARELTIAMIAALEGAFVLARALRSTEPLMLAGELMANAVEAAIVEG